MAVRLVTVVWVYPNNRDKRVSCVYANTPRAWCKYIWVVLSIFLLVLSRTTCSLVVKREASRPSTDGVFRGILADRVRGTPTRTVHLADCMSEVSHRVLLRGCFFFFTYISTSWYHVCKFVCMYVCPTF